MTQTLKGIKVISFDLDGTLWNFESAMVQGLETVLGVIRGRDPIAGSRLTVRGLIDTRDVVAREFSGDFIDLELIRLESFRRSLGDIGRANDSLAEEVFNVYVSARFRCMEPYDDVVPVIQSLRSTYTIGAISNGNSYPDRLGLSHLFDFEVMAELVGYSKPDPRIFHAALREAGCEAGELLHIGDDIEADVRGAVRAGANALLIDRNGPQQALPPEVRTITNLNQLAGLLHG